MNETNSESGDSLWFNQFFLLIVFPDLIERSGRREAAELERQLSFVVARQILVRCASAESLSQDSRLAETPISIESRMSMSKSFTIDMEKKILVGRFENIPFDDDEATASGARERRVCDEIVRGYSKPRDASSRKCDAGPQRRSSKNQKCDEGCPSSSTDGERQKGMCDAGSASQCDDPVVGGVLRRCSTKRYALVRQAKVVGSDRHRNRIDEKPGDEKTGS